MVPDERASQSAERASATLCSAVREGRARARARARREIMRVLTRALADARERVRALDRARALGFAVTVYVLASALASTPTSVLLNVPVSAMLTAFGIVIITALARASEREDGRRRRTSWRTRRGTEELRGDEWSRAPKGSDSVETIVRNFPEVWAAWLALREKIVCDYVTEMWYDSLTDDAEFPNTLRTILDGAFATLSTRAREIDLVSIALREIPDVLSQSLEAYRSARGEIGEEEFRKLCPEDAEDVLACTLRKQNELHPAVSGEVETTRALRALAKVMARALLDEEFSSPLTMSLVRELLVVSLLRPLLGFAKPHWMNRGVLFVTGQEVDYGEDGKSPTLDVEVTPDPASRSESGEPYSASTQHSRSASGNSSDAVPNGLYSNFKMSARVTGGEIVGSGNSSYAVYLVTVSTSENQTWVVPRRFRNFENLHRRLRDVDKVAVSSLNFPSKSWIKTSLSGAFIESRRKALDEYLRAVLANNKLADSNEVLTFMDARPGIYDPDKPSTVAPEIMKSMSEAMEGVASMVSSYAMGDSTDSAADGEVATDKGDDTTTGPLDESRSMKRPPRHRRISSMYEDSAQEPTSTPMSTIPSWSDGGSDLNDGDEQDSFVVDVELCMQGPVLELFESVFSLRSKPMMRRALVTLVRQTIAFIFSIERSISKRFREFRSAPTMARTIAWIRRVVWPEVPYPRDTAERLACEAETARQALLRVFTNQNVQTIMGTRASARAAQDVYALLQSPTCCRHVGFVVLETIIIALFPEILAVAAERSTERASPPPSSPRARDAARARCAAPVG